MNPDEEREKIQREILVIIEERLRSGDMSAERAREIARMVLDKLGHHMTMEELQEVAPRLDDTFSELGGAILPLIQKHDEEMRKNVNEQVHNLIINGKIAEADEILRKVLRKEEKA